ncbi:hypothetical protein [Streptomyces sp. NBC_00878]|uniref:hypothetical protein n=1 Tax=Streptomyces sp. NBC_00878 TaxID=2975854 RepID=UPI00225A69B5|nr:hypothetical protein [Streptomyces sp. NBC_00878]MCX4908328.1 hypothetical protein [Streptomyces sp. NBC_00878]
MAASSASRRNLKAKAGLAKKRRGKQGKRIKESVDLLEMEYRSGNIDTRGLIQGMAQIKSYATRMLDGQCRIQTPYAPLRAILGKDGFRYCCTHKPVRHCSKAP